MNAAYHFRSISRTFIIVFALFSGSMLLAQTEETPVADSTKVQAISIAELPSEMVQTRIKTIKILNDIIQSEGLQKDGERNDSLLTNVKETLSEIKESTKDTKSVRYLENRKLQLQTLDENVRRLSDHFSTIINQLDQSATYYKNEKVRWEVTREDLKKNNYSTEFLGRINDLELLLDSALNEVSLRTEAIFVILEKNATTAIEIDDLLDQIEHISDELEAQLLKADRPSIFNLDYSAENLTFKEDFKFYIKEIITDLSNYFEHRRAGLYTLLILFIVLVYLGYKNKKRLTDLDRYGNSYYQRKLGQILAEPIDAAILLSLVFSNIILTDRPYAFRDILGFLLIWPLLRVSYQLLAKPFHKYINWAALLMLPILIYVIFPPESVYFRYNLLLIALGELYIANRFYIHLKSLDEDKQKLNKRLLIPASIIIMAFAAIGLIGSIVGQVLLAQIVLFTNYYAIFGGAMLYATSIMINGFLLTFLDTERAQKINTIFKYNNVIRKRFVRTVNVIIFTNWIIIIFDQLKIKNTIVDALIFIFGKNWTIGAITLNLAEVVVFFFLIWLSTFISKIIQIFLEDDILNKMPLAKGLPHSIAVLIRYTIITMGVMLAISSAGLSMSSLAVVLGAFGVGIGFGLQNIFNNLVSGLILLFERPVQIGDTIEIGNLIGTVKHIGIRSSNVRTIDGAEVIVPNGNLISNEVINWTLSDAQRRIEVIVGVSYSSDPEQVLQILIKVLKEHPHILQDPEPAVYFQELGDSSLNFRMLFWASSYDEWPKIKSQVITRVFNDLADHDIEIPFPQRDIHIRSIEEKLTVAQENRPSETPDTRQTETTADSTTDSYVEMKGGIVVDKHEDKETEDDD